ncbi:WbqC family protein [Pontibacillus salicampi]|uniref:WbqC family protein n=1 Tax=Pontibacillus salicampi TaxID=1449801 RepID=A0ABV6LT37_9BACI
MKLGIMQPYLFPYIGYFQLINAVDTFVLFDDVQYIKRGWINRNRILVNGREHLFTFSIKKASQHNKINQTFFSERFPHEKDDFLKTLHANYKKTENYNVVYSIVQEALNINVDNNVSEAIRKSILLINNYLDIQTEIIMSSSLDKKESVAGQEHILEICNRLGASKYVNAIGGRDLYSSHSFREQNIDLMFLEPTRMEYKQFNNNFIPNLSIIDVLMLNNKNKIKQLLDCYHLIK